MRGMKFRIALLALTLAACGAETPVRTSQAGGDAGTKPAPTPAATQTATAKPAGSASFRTPTGRLACAVVDNGLVCDVRQQQGDEGFPEPDSDISEQCSEFSPTQWGNGVTLPFVAEPAFPNCSSGVNVVDEDPPALDYGTTWERDGFTCVSEEKGLTCTRGEHGFFANRDVIETH